MTREELGRAFLASAVLPADRAATPDPRARLAERAGAYRYQVDVVPLAELPRWHLGDDLAHDTRRFFTVEGLAVTTNFGAVSRWTQPIIVQPEIGILGFLARRIDGVLHLLAQAKMEPGNQQVVQFSPTVQATPSNYTRVHGGRATPHLEHFIGPGRGRVLVDLLQSEQGSRYYRKRNRNLIVELPDDDADVAIDASGDFAWLSLAQIRELLVAGGYFNMNARSVLACVFYAGTPPVTGDAFRDAVLASHLAPVSDDELARALTWLADQKSVLDVDVRRIKLSELEDWIVDRDSIRHASGKFFRIIGTTITATSREVGAWTQPMLAPVDRGTIGFVLQRRDGVLHALVQARVEPGFIDRVELGATLQVTPANHAAGHLPPFCEYLNAPAGWVRVRASQSEDGGRFYHDNTENLVVELPEDERVELPPNYRWMTLGLLKRLMRRGYVVDIEARSLLACLG